MVKKTTAHNDYWGKRSADIIRHIDRTDVDMFTELQKIYAEGSAEMQKELFAFVSKYAEDGSMSYQEALQRLRGVDLSDYQANAEKYRKQAEKDPELLRRLNDQYATSKVTRMDALNLEMAYKLGVMQGVIDKSIGNYFKSVAEYAYKKAMGGNSGAINTPALEELVRTPFYGKNYSERIWGNTDNLASDLRDILKRGFIRGDDVRSMAGELAKKYNVARSRAQTLVRTDGTAIVNRSAIRRYQDAGLEYYRISVQMDNRTSETCKRIYAEDKRYKMDEFEPGVTAPPFHFNCRSAVIPDEDEIEEKELESLKSSSYNQDMTNLDLMAKSQLYSVGDRIRVSAKKVQGSKYDFWAQDNTKKIRDTIENVSTTLDSLDNSFKIPRIVFIKHSRLNAFAGYNQAQDVLFVSDILSSQNAIQGLLVDNYFASKNISDILKHELTHKQHWDSAKAFYKNNKKRYNSLEVAMSALNSPLMSYVKTQQSQNMMYLYDISIDALAAFEKNNINELVAEVGVLGENTPDSVLLEKVEEVLKWK